MRRKIEEEKGAVTYILKVGNSGKRARIDKSVQSAVSKRRKGFEGIALWYICYLPTCSYGYFAHALSRLHSDDVGMPSFVSPEERPCLLDALCRSLSESPLSLSKVLLYDEEMRRKGRNGKQAHLGAKPRSP